MISRRKEKRKVIVTLMTLVIFLLMTYSSTILAAPKNQTTSSTNNAQLVASAQRALINAGTLEPVEGTDTNLIAMAQAIVDSATTSKVEVTISSSYNSQISSTGKISYGSSAVIGKVNFKLIKNNIKVIQSITVIVPAAQSAALVDKAALITAISAAKTNAASVIVSTDGADVSPTNQWVTATVMTAYTNAIASAQAVVNNAASSQSNIDNSVSAVASASTTFNAAKQPGTKVDKAALTAAISAAKTNAASAIVSINGSDVSPTNQWVTAAVMTVYTSAIASAQAVFNNAASTQSIVDNSVSALASATTTFNAAKKIGTKVDKNALTAAISAAKTNAASTIVSIDGSDIASTNQWVTEAVKTAYTNAIASAQAVVDNAASTQSIVDNSVSALASATTIFNTAKKPGTKGEINVRNYGAKGDGITDDTTAIQNAINDAYTKGIKEIVIPDGTYMINALKSIKPKSGQTLRLSDSATLQAIPNSSDGYYVVKLSNVSDVNVIGGNIKGERSKHSGVSGQWGMVLGVLSCNNINISNVNISDGWGDGIYLGVMSSYQDYNSNITIENVKSDNNRRAGLSIISVKGLTVRDSIFCNTNGNSPMSGINLEPNSTTDLLQDILIENVTCYNNGVAADQVNGWGLDMWLRAGTSSMYGLPKANVSVDVVNLTAYGNYRGGICKNIMNYYIPAGYNISIK